VAVVNGTRGLLRLACRLTVSLWAVLALAWSAVSQTPPSHQPTARVEPRREEPPAPPREEAASRPVRVGRAELERGDELLDEAGAFPAISSSYEAFGSFRDYALAMQALGARFVVVRERRIVGVADVATGALDAAPVGSDFSPRARDYTGEPGLVPLARRARERFGGAAVVMMLVPRALDAGLFGGIARALDERGERHGAYREIRASYRRGASGGVLLRVDAGVRRDGAEVGMDLLFDLAEIAREGGAAA
jgi:hypothetical protein